MAAATPGKTILIVAADAGWLECAGGTVAKRTGEGADAILVRVGNDEKESWGLSPEETAWRNRNESEAAAKLLGIQEVVSLGYRSSELRDVPHTTLRDRLIFLIRHHRPAVAHVHPSGSTPRLSAEGCTGALYLPRPVHFARRSSRILSKSCSLVS